jgi:hypothetical protein
MSSRSTYGKYIYTKSTEIAEDMPLSAHKMTALSSNLQHLIDCHGQYRVHYAAPSTGNLAIDNAAYDLVYEAKVPWSYLTTDGKPFSPYLKITGQTTTGNSIRAAATLGWLPTASDDYADGLFFSNVLWWLGSTVTATTDTTLIDAIIDTSENEKLKQLSIWDLSYNVTDLDEAGSAWTYRPIRQTELRLSVFVLGQGSINYIQLREFCVS